VAEPATAADDGDAGELPDFDIEVSNGQMRIPVADDDGGSRSERALAEPPPATGDEPPRIRKVWLRNFKGFARFEATLGMFNVLAGANNSGKSTLLQGIDLLYSLLKLHREGDQLADTGRLLPPSILPVANVRDLYYKQISRRANAYVLATVGAEFSDDSAVEFGIRYLFGNPNSRVTRNQGMDRARLMALVSKPAVWVPSAVGIVRDEEYRTPARRASLINDGRHHEVLRNLLLDLRQKDNQRFETLQTVLHDRFGAKLGDLEFDEIRDQFVRADYANDVGTHHDLYSAGAGFVQVTQLLAFILGKRAGIVLLDEPDAHLHSSLQRVVVEVLDDISRREGFQVILATHSKEIINFVDPTRLILVESGADHAAPVSDEVTPMAIMRSLGAIDNVDAYALVRNRRCLFVEGSGDVSILGRFAATLGIRALTGDDRVVTVPVGGADRFEHVKQLDVFEAMLGNPVGSLELRDRDGMTDDHRDKVVAAAERPLLVWELDSIESYLIGPTVIARVVNEIAVERALTVEVTEAEIEKTIDESCEELKTTALDRLGQRFTEDVWRHSGERIGVPRANEAARAMIDENWQTIEGKLRVVSGKQLLSVIRRMIQDAYGVNFGNERLAETFVQEEVPAEIAEALRRVAELDAPQPTADATTVGPADA
jgi:predicted ATPase